MIQTPIKSCSTEETSQRHLLSAEGKSTIAGSHLGGGETEGSSTVIAEGDILAQFTRVMGKGSHTVLLVFAELFWNFRKSCRLSIATPQTEAQTLTTLQNKGFAM